MEKIKIVGGFVGEGRGRKLNRQTSTLPKKEKESDVKKRGKGKF